MICEGGVALNRPQQHVAPITEAANHPRETHAGAGPESEDSSALRYRRCEHRKKPPDIITDGELEAQLGRCGLALQNKVGC